MIVRFDPQDPIPVAIILEATAEVEAMMELAHLAGQQLAAQGRHDDAAQSEAVARAMRKALGREH